MFSDVYAYSLDVVEVAPPGAAEDHRSARTCKQKITISVAPVSACAVSPTVVKYFFYSDLALNALPVHLLRQFVQVS